MTDKQVTNKIAELEEKLQAKEKERERLKFKNKRLNELALYWHKRFFEVGRSELKFKQALQEIFKCLIMANRAGRITDTLWFDDSTTLWSYIAQTLGIEGDQLEIEEQVLNKIDEVENEIL